MQGSSDVFYAYGILRNRGSQRNELDHWDLAAGIVMLNAQEKNFEADFDSLEKTPALMREILIQRCANLLDTFGGIPQKLIFHYKKALESFTYEEYSQIYVVKKALDKHTKKLHQRIYPSARNYIIKEAKKIPIKGQRPDIISFPESLPSKPHFFVNKQRIAEKAL